MNIYKKQVGTTLFIAMLFAVMFGCTNSKVNNAKDKNGSVTFGICTDVHHNVIHDAPRRLGIFVDDMIDKKADFVIEMGDFCYPDSTSNSFMEVFNRFKNDKYFVLGNHDRDNGVTREQSINYFGMPAAYYSFDKNGFHFIVMDGNEEGMADDGYPLGISDEQKEWLINDLNSTYVKTIVFMHQSFVYDIENGEEIRNIISSQKLSDGNKKVIVCFNGHKHTDQIENFDGIWYVTINSMSDIWVGEDFEHKIDGIPDSVYEQKPDLKFVCPYVDPLYAFVNIYNDGTVVIKGQSSTWMTPTPEDLGYSLSDEEIPKVSDRKGC